jgi:hypothetical protein
MKIYAWIAFAFGALLVLFGVRKSGQEVERHKTMVETLKGVRKRDKIENTIITTSDNELNKLRRKWTK